MAQAQQPREEGDAEFVRRIVTDPNNVPDVMRLYGYLGASSEENHERLYLSPDLSTYVEVPRDAILHRMAVRHEQDPHGAVILWVKRDAALISKMAPAAQALVHYFAGAIQAAAGAAAGGGAAPMAGAAPGTFFTCMATCGRFCTLVDCTPLCTPQCPTHQASCFATCASCFGTCVPACSPACPSPPWVGCTPACMSPAPAGCTPACLSPPAVCTRFCPTQICRTEAICGAAPQAAGFSHFPCTPWCPQLGMALQAAGFSHFPCTPWCPQ